MGNSFLTQKQCEDIKTSLSKIKIDVDNILDNNKVTGGDLLYFYDELEKKARFARNYLSSAEMIFNIEKGKSFSEIEKES